MYHDLEKRVDTTSSTDDSHHLHNEVFQRFFWHRIRIYWCSVLLLSLMLTNCALMMGESPNNHRKAETSDDLHEHTFENDFDNSNIYDKDSRKALVPPSGHPWHRWASSSIDARPLIRELELIDKLSEIKEVSDKNV